MADGEGRVLPPNQNQNQNPNQDPNQNPNQNLSHKPKSEP